MKPKIKPYILHLLNENFFYIISFFGVLIILLIIFFSGISKIINGNKELKKLETELLDLRNKVKLLNYDEEKTKKINYSIEILNMLIPNFEDYFSIIYSLEKLSYKTGFMIVNYSIDMNASSQNKIKLSVTGIGDSNTFLNFLKDYNFSGGRLITSDNIEYNIQKNDNVKINLTFYNKNPKSFFSDEKKFTVGNSDIQENNNIDNILLEIDNIKDKIVFDLSEIDAKEIVDYSVKSNPFK